MAEPSKRQRDGNGIHGPDLSDRLFVVCWVSRHTRHMRRVAWSFDFPGDDSANYHGIKRLYKGSWCIHWHLCFDELLGCFACPSRRPLQVYPLFQKRGTLRTHIVVLILCVNTTLTHFFEMSDMEATASSAEHTGSVSTPPTCCRGLQS